jgi:ParB-like chromosome segregation protein Spo0J
MKNKPKIEILKTDSLIPYARNSRTHSEAQVAQIAGSIREFGFTNPVLIDGENGIIAGHGRIMAAQKLGLAEVPCIRLDHLTETQRKAYVIADNKLALNSCWDEEMLGLELADLREMDFDLTLTGFDGDEIETFLNPLESADIEKEWAESGMPDYDGTPKGEGGTIIVHFAKLEDRNRFAEILQIKINAESKFCWYPERPE